MRLRNVETRRLQEFFGETSPDHTKKRGYTKIDGICCLAARNGFKWVWVDTCCIDNTSSAELSEAINSMYKWYKDSSTCYAYLEDVQQGDDPSSFDRQLCNSRWFTRGWTLQELLAPETVEFFDAAWENLGTRSSLAPKIESITKIPTDFLERNEESPAIRSAKIAMRMSWAARRQTTRVEDRAYSLLGIFDVNMPLLYGEGEGAFERLQIEIMKKPSDDSILAWARKGETGIILERERIELMERNDMKQSTDNSTLVLTSEGKGKGALESPQTEMMGQPSDDSIPSWTWKYEGKPEPVKNLDSIFGILWDKGLLAQCPDDFAWWTSTQPMDFYEKSNFGTDMTTRGLHVTLPVLKGRGECSYVVLNCMLDNSLDQILAVRLYHTDVADEYEREADGLVTLSWQVAKKCQQMTFYLLNSDQQRLPDVPSLWNDWRSTVIRIQGPDDWATRLVRVRPKNSYQRERSLVVVKDIHNEHWPQILLHYKKIPMDDEQDDSSNGDGFVVVLEKRTPLRAIFSLELEPPPFVCYTIPMRKKEELEHLVPENLDERTVWNLLHNESRNLSEPRNGFSLKAGAPQAKIEREKFLDRERFLVKISYTQSLAQYARSVAVSITHLYLGIASPVVHALRFYGLLLITNDVFLI
ncbi:HET domain-containing protein [Colletotrichum cuscutae]|uniref:HET domain-containing protein n=1 Tax=Colletotrichum cuscutae TaxID=1209917 RepID=A0AAI9Y0Y1_9PEZI|nr:HET domain-containing protein [Colletotrichum cuscutae]